MKMEPLKLGLINIKIHRQSHSISLSNFGVACGTGFLELNCQNSDGLEVIVGSFPTASNGRDPFGFVACLLGFY
jgi:hypothetical protein